MNRGNLHGILVFSPRILGGEDEVGHLHALDREQRGAHRMTSRIQVDRDEATDQSATQHTDLSHAPPECCYDVKPSAKDRS